MIKELYDKKRRLLAAEEKIAERVFKTIGKLPLLRQIPLYGTPWRLWKIEAKDLRALWKAFKPVPLVCQEKCSLMDETKVKKAFVNAAPFWITKDQEGYHIHWIGKCLKERVHVSVSVAGFESAFAITKRWAGGYQTIWFDRDRVCVPWEVVRDAAVVGDRRKTL